MWLKMSHTQLATSLQVQRLHFWFEDWRQNTWTCHSVAFFRQETTLYDVSPHPGVKMRTSDIELGLTQWWTSNPSMEMGRGRGVVETLLVAYVSEIGIRPLWPCGKKTQRSSPLFFGWILETVGESTCAQLYQLKLISYHTAAHKSVSHVF